LFSFDSKIPSQASQKNPNNNKKSTNQTPKAYLNKQSYKKKKEYKRRKEYKKRGYLGGFPPERWGLRGHRPPNRGSKGDCSPLIPKRRSSQLKTARK
jgi:hypothetical protein